MKKLFCLFFCMFFISLSAYADNILQQNFEKQPYDKDFPKDALFLINDDFNGYARGGKSMYGILLALKEDYVFNKKNLDLGYINKALQSYEQAYIKQNTNCLHYIKIEDNHYSQLSKDTKELIKFYNFIYKLSL